MHNKWNDISCGLYILCSMIFFLRKSCRLWDNAERHGREVQGTDDNTTRRMRIACWILKARNTLRICNTYRFSTETVVMRWNLNVTLHVFLRDRFVQHRTDWTHPELLKFGLNYLLSWYLHSSELSYAWNTLYRVIQEESARLREMIVSVILSKKVHMNMGPILNDYGVMTAWNSE